MEHQKQMKPAYILLTSWGLWASSGFLSGQTYTPQRGVVPNGFYELSQIETIDAVGGSVTLQIPITSFPPGRAGSGFELSLTYNSAIYALTPLNQAGNNFELVDPISTSDPYDESGWHYNYQYNIVYNTITLPSSTLPCEPGTASLTLVMPDGSSRPLNSTLSSYEGGGIYQVGCSEPALSGTFYTSDGTYIAVNIDGNFEWTIFFPDGRTVNHNQSTGVETISDHNGNKITVTGSGTSTILSDDLGRTITIATSVSGTTTVDTITQAGYNNQQLPWTVTWPQLSTPANYQCINGDTDTAQYCPFASEAPVQSINLPDGLSYQFQYYTTQANFAQMSQITLPTGAYVNYGYSSYLPFTDQTPGFIASKSLNWTDQNFGNAPRTESSTYSFTPTSSTFASPDGGTTTHYFYQASTAGISPYLGLVYKVVQPNGSVVEKIWSQNLPYGSASYYPGNPYVQTELDSVGTSSGPTSAMAKSYTLDRNGNATQITESDWFPYGNISHQTNTYSDPVNGYVSGYSGANVLRTTVNTYINGAQAATSTGYATSDPNGYWNLLTPQLLRLPCTTTVGPAITQYAYDGQTSVNCSPSSGQITKGNPVQIQRWDSAASLYRTTTNAYDTLGNGNLVSTQNPRGFTTDLTYDSNNLYVIQKNVAVEDTTNTRKFTYNHDLYTGVLTSQTDSDHSITTNYGYDEYARLTSVQEGGVRSMYYVYNDSARTITEKSDRNCYGDSNGATCAGLPAGTPTGALMKVTSYDPLGRIAETQDWAGNLIQNDTYVGSVSVSGTCPETSTGNYQLASNPSPNPQSDSSLTMGWTRTRLDTLGRVVEVKHYSGSALPTPFAPTGSTPNCNITGIATYAYNANATTYADEASNSWVRSTNGLGQLTTVTENGISATTTYGYDALDDLISVTPAAGTGRSLVYTSLKQLQSATNPETGTISYTYDANGNLLTKTDGRSIVTTYCYNTQTTSNLSTVCYNGLDQLLGKSYSDSTSDNPTPWVRYTYNKQWLTQVAAGNNSYSYDYDTIGRVNGGIQTTNGTSYAFSNMAYLPYLGLQTIQYPNSSRMITTAFDPGGRPASLSGQIGSNAATTYVSGTTFQNDGAINTRTFGNSMLVQTQQDNSRLQPTSIQFGNLLTLGYGYSATQNNGNVTSQTIARNNNAGASIGNWTTNYGYDAVNRVTGASEVVTGTTTPLTWSEAYNYTVTGNRSLTSDPSGLPTPSSEVPIGTGSAYTASNQISGWYYDGAGNITGIPATSGTNVRVPCAANVPSGGMLRVACYDAENRMTSVTDSNGNTSTYVYDGDGRRVQKTVPSTGTTVFVYDAMGNLAQEYGPPPIAGGTEYLFADMLGSTRLVTDNTGNTLRCYDYLPFGEEIEAGFGGRPSSSCFNAITYPTTPDILSEKFTSKERDAESGLDYFGARYFSSAQGRWTSPDWSEKPQPVPYADLTDPQTLNLYGYVRNNPLKQADLDGHADCGGETDKSWLFCLGNALGLNQTETQKADEARTFFELNPQYDANGSLIDPSKETNAQVIARFQDYNHQREAQLTLDAIASAPDRALDAYVNLVEPQRQVHILDGDATGGGHRAGTGLPGKSEFPASWSDQKILHDISDIATDPNARQVSDNGRVRVVEGTRDGLNIEVVVRNGQIITAYPTNVPRNP
jgi:RHS repeat-associated protein